MGHEALQVMLLRARQFYELAAHARVFLVAASDAGCITNIEVYVKPTVVAQRDDGAGQDFPSAVGQRGVCRLHS